MQPKTTMKEKIQAATDTEHIFKEYVPLRIVSAISGRCFCNNFFTIFILYDKAFFLDEDILLLFPH